MNGPIDDPKMESVDTTEFWRHATPQQLVLLTRTNELYHTLQEIEQALAAKDQRIDALVAQIKTLGGEPCQPSTTS